MNSLNSILVEGNLTRDPELRTTPKGTPVCSFSVASNRFFRQNEETQKEVSFFDVEVWSGLAERCGENLNKGRGVRVVGRLKQDRWTDGEGQNHTRVKIVGEHVEFRPVFSKSEASEKALEDDEDSDVEAPDGADESEFETQLEAEMAVDAVVAEAEHEAMLRDKEVVEA
ncbi:MAG: single-stranded DNA-binding protein [Spirochaeta sp.]|nr:single-stranded DNA-binding protein [Spirochaeta sp.]